MDNLAVVQIDHALGNIFGPPDDLSGCKRCTAVKEVVEWPVLTELHDNAIVFSFRADATETNYNIEVGKKTKSN